MIYTTGTIAIDGNTVTGTGTNFSAPLSLIRVGCTIIAVENPVQIFTITEIKNSTELSVTPAADPAIPAGTKFSILLSDSLSVDGLAQDVAETLRYYQGRETEISEAVEFFKNFNLHELKDLVKQTEDSANAAKTSEENAAQLEQSALDIKNQTEQLKAETYQIKNDTQSIKDSADLARDSANTHANNAKNAKDAAESARDDAEQFAKQVNPENLLHKDKNLSDIADRAAAWLNVRPIGSTPLSGDPVDDYDATTKRWVLNTINTGTVGPTMNGVMNYGVGDFHLRDSRAYIQPYEVASDGQLLNRADWPELWAYAQMISPIEDTEWLADPANRGKYSTGDGSTTFRVPDRNGVQTGSINSLYGRGDGGNSSLNGTVIESGAPDIQGSIRTVSAAAVFENTGQSGAFYSQEAGYPYADLSQVAAPGSATNYPRSVIFSAKLSNPVYGRTTTEIRPNSFIGVWVIRASGGFVAANTSWSVINADTSRPSNGTKATGGVASSEYKIGTSIEAQTKLGVDAYIGGNYYATLSIYNKTKGNEKVLAFSDDGTLISDRYTARFGTLMSWTETGSARGTFGVEDQNIGANYGFNSIVSASQASDGGYKTATHLGMIHFNGTSFAQSCWQVAGDVNAAYGVRLAIQPLNDSVFFNRWEQGTYETFTLQKNAVSDENLKHDIEPVSVDKSWSNLRGLEFVTFVYNNDAQKRVRRGVIAQQVETVDPLYVKTREFYDDNHVKRSQKELDTHPMLLDTMHVVQTLMQKIETMEAEIAELKASK